jgi:uncharacterized protein (UPF0147 family)
LAECEDVIRLLTAKLEETVGENDQLREENARLRSDIDAHTVLKEIYSDPAVPQGLRVKAAQAALNIEKPRLLPEKAPLELQAEPVECLADVVARQRARADRMQRERRNITVLPSGQVLLLDERNGGDGQDD